MTSQTSELNLRDRPIGVFDSGMGGLTVLKELRQWLPYESLVYLGDTARLPYGTKSLQTVQRYARQMTEWLRKQSIKLLIIACNTATTAALSYLQTEFFDLPIIGVVEPGALTAVEQTLTNRVAVIATETTIRANIYALEIQKRNAHIQTLNLACGLLVALAEEGCINDTIAISAIKKYLAPIKNNHNEIDCLLLGCTHFPVFKPAIQKFLGSKIKIVDSAAATAKTVHNYLVSNNLTALASNNEWIRYFVTDQPERFARVGSIFFSNPIDPSQVELIDCVSLHNPFISISRYA